MQHLLKEVTDLLMKDSRLVAGGRLLKNKVTELALAMDADLLELLLRNSATKKYFFQQVGSIAVFDKIRFTQFITSKSFLPDSYTAFKNKIGLTADGHFISSGK